MGLQPLVPPVPTGGPFTLDVARRAGLTWKQLQGPTWLRISYGLYLWAGSSAVRTVFDLGCRPPLVEAVVAADMALHARLVGPAEIYEFAAARAASRGIRQFRRAIDFAEPATESPMETRMRMLLVLNGLPKPEVQVTLRNDQGHFLGRPDFYYPAHRLALEYDGGTHHASLVADNRRQNLLINAGFRILRFTFADVNGTPDAVVNQVRAALRLPPPHARP